MYISMRSDTFLLQVSDQVQTAEQDLPRIGNLHRDAPQPPVPLHGHLDIIREHEQAQSEHEAGLSISPEPLPSPFPPMLGFSSRQAPMPTPGRAGSAPARIQEGGHADILQGLQLDRFAPASTSHQLFKYTYILLLQLHVLDL